MIYKAPTSIKNQGTTFVL